MKCDECGKEFKNPKNYPLADGFYGEFKYNGTEFTVALCKNCNTVENIRKIVKKMKEMVKEEENEEGRL